ncbi:hypothetical protein [Marinifilum flexuosum]|uniref:hypothetical protein n=1 Tax=Marinifilum flexuosum TaxID=1117708 RepID=UPI0024945FAF|nr:hypothetical protein [Marinifilum flexuosum]
MKVLLFRGLIVFGLSLVYNIDVFAQEFDLSELRRHHYESFGNLDEVEGQIFFNEDWEKGIVYFNTEYKVSDVPIKYLVKGGEMLIDHKGQVLAISNPQTMDSILINKHKFIYTQLMYGSKIKDDYIELLGGDEKLQLLKYYTCRFIKGRDVSSYSAPDPDRYVLKVEYYIRRNNEVAELIKVNKKSILQLLADRREKVQAFVKKNKLKVGREDDLIKIFNHYNGLF